MIQHWLRDTSRTLVDRNAGLQISYTVSKHLEDVERAIQCSSFKDTAAIGTGLPDRINQERVYDVIEGPVVLELVHMTDVGCPALALERVRQYRENRALQARIDHTASDSEGEGLDWDGPLQQYPRRCLKLFLSDGIMELQAMELERLPFELGVTPMGTKV